MGRGLGHLKYRFLTHTHTHLTTHDTHKSESEIFFITTKKTNNNKSGSVTRVDLTPTVYQVGAYTILATERPLVL